jgi:hypothetical protein
LSVGSKIHNDEGKAFWMITWLSNPFVSIFGILTFQDNIDSICQLQFVILIHEKLVWDD